jgi:pimeloyl-ACP methyl ester carboxylesterase
MAAEREISTTPFPGWSAGAEECWRDIDGARMRYLRAGSGPALILLHGLLGYSFSWRYTMPALAPYATVYAPDMMHGGAVAMMAAAECLGGKAGLHLRRLVLVAPVNPYSAHGQRLAPFAGSNFGSILFRFGVFRMSFLYPMIHARLYYDRSRIPPGTLEGYMAPLAKPGLFDHALSIVRTWSQDLRELEATLPKLAGIPTLLMWGDKDPAVYASSAAPLAKYFPNSKLIVFPGIGHLPYEECPEEFNRALIEFLTREKLPA